MTTENAYCAYCLKDTAHTLFLLKERMFGLPGEFEYLQCNSCEAMHIKTVPTNLAHYYPSDYYSFAEKPLPDYSGGPKDKLLRLRDLYEWTGMNSFGKLLAQLKPNPQLRYLWPLKLDLDATILDIGCGTGHLLKVLRSLGFTKLTGVDPFIPSTIHEPNLKIIKGELEELSGSFDVVMMHHALEHVVDQKRTLSKCKELLAPGGKLMIRIPTISCEAWEEYGLDWFQLDAPRHMVLHSRKSISRLAEQCDLVIEQLIDDGSPDQYIFCELYKRGLPMIPRDEATKKRIADEVAAMPRAEFEERSRQLNQTGRADQINLVMSARSLS